MKRILLLLALILAGCYGGWGIDLGGGSSGHSKTYCEKYPNEPVCQQEKKDPPVKQTPIPKCEHAAPPIGCRWILDPEGKCKKDDLYCDAKPAPPNYHRLFAAAVAGAATLTPQYNVKLTGPPVTEAYKAGDTVYFGQDANTFSPFWVVVPKGELPSPIFTPPRGARVDPSTGIVAGSIRPILVIGGTIPPAPAPVPVPVPTPTPVKPPTPVPTPMPVDPLQPCPIPPGYWVIGFRFTAPRGVDISGGDLVSVKYGAFTPYRAGEHVIWTRKVSAAQGEFEVRLLLSPKQVADGFSLIADGLHGQWEQQCGDVKCYVRGL